MFATSPNILYRFLGNLDSSRQYELHILNRETDHEIKATTQLVQNFRALNPISSEFPIDFSDTSQYTFEWTSAINGRVYELVLRLNYLEKSLQSGDTTSRFIDWQVFKNQTSVDAGGNDVMRFKINQQSFYAFVNSELEPNPEIRRDVRSIDLHFYSGGEELLLLLLNATANSGITELNATPEYTNIEGGLGIFSSRHVEKIENITLTDSSVDSLACGRITGHLNFASSLFNPYYPGCE
jgi:hypothetical protein